MDGFKTSVGMEVHAELQTRSKMFCRCAAAFGGEPNTRVCPVCLALPGSLPVPNQQAVEMVVRTALALNCTVAEHSVFHRKNYFYPDLPKGYQISQYGETNPIGHHGYLDIPTSQGNKRIHIARVHLEEDTGKLTHLGPEGSGVDYNRAGVPLMEIVTAFPPDIESPEEAREYLVQLRHILVYLGVCDGKMEEGSLRCEPNISVRTEDQAGYGTKTELKNLNSFKSVQLGVAHEVARHIDILQTGGKVRQETRGWSEEKECSYPMRVKEEENDYRYFADPDLAPLLLSPEWVGEVRSAMPELPLAKAARYQKDLRLSPYDANLMVQDRDWAEFFEAGVAQGADPKALLNLMNSELAKLLNESGGSVLTTKVTPQHLVDLTSLIAQGAISGKMAKQVFAKSFQSGVMPSHIVQQEGLSQVTDENAIKEAVYAVLYENQDSVAKYKNGQTGVLGFLIGLVMKQTQGRANPQLVRKTIEEELEK